VLLLDIFYAMYLFSVFAGIFFRQCVYLKFLLGIVLDNVFISCFCGTFLYAMRLCDVFVGDFLTLCLFAVFAGDFVMQCVYL